MNVTTPAGERSPARLSFHPNNLAGLASAALYMLAAVLMLRAPQPDPLGLCLLGVAFVQLLYMAFKPTLPWVVVVFWVIVQWQTALLALERAPSPHTAALLALAVVVQAYLVLAIGLAGLAHLREMRRLRPPPKPTP
jgi:hypothetical protein